MKFVFFSFLMFSFSFTPQTARSAENSTPPTIAKELGECNNLPDKESKKQCKKKVLGNDIDNNKECDDSYDEFSKSHKELLKKCDTIIGLGSKEDCVERVLECKEILSKDDDDDENESKIQSALEEKGWSIKDFGSNCPQLSSELTSEKQKEQEKELKEVQKSLGEAQKEFFGATQGVTSAKNEHSEKKQKSFVNLYRTIEKLNLTKVNLGREHRKGIIERYGQQIDLEEKLAKLNTRQKGTLDILVSNKLQTSVNCRKKFEVNRAAFEIKWSEKMTNQVRYSSPRSGLNSTSLVRKNKIALFIKDVKVPYQQCLKDSVLLKKSSIDAANQELDYIKSERASIYKRLKQLEAKQLNARIAYEENMQAALEQEQISKTQHDQLKKSLEDQMATERRNALNKQAMGALQMTMAQKNANKATNTLTMSQMYGTSDREYDGNIFSLNAAINNRDAELSTYYLGCCKPEEETGKHNHCSNWKDDFDRLSDEKSTKQSKATEKRKKGAR